MKLQPLLYFCIASSFFCNAQNISTFAGTGSSAVTGIGGPANMAGVPNPTGGQFDKYGNFFFADAAASRIFKIDPAGIITLVAGSNSSGFSGDFGPATSAKLNGPTSARLDSFNNLYIADEQNHRIRKVDISTGTINTIAGNGVPAFGGDAGPATAASFWGIQDICLDKHGNIYIADGFNYRIRKIDAATGIIKTIAGTGIPGYSGEGTLADTSKVGLIVGLCADTADNIYLSSNTVCRIMKLSPSGILTTVAGTGSPTYTTDGIPAISASFGPFQIAIDSFSNIYAADKANQRVYKIDHTTGIFTTIAGIGTVGDSGDGGPATAATLYNPVSVAVDQCGNVYISTIGAISVPGAGRRIRKVTFSTTGASAVISITASPHDTVCAGTPVTYTASVSGAAPTGYQWYVNGAVTGATSATYTYTPSNGDSIRVTFTGNEICNGALVSSSSNTINMTVQPLLTPTVTISSASTAPVGSVVTVNAVVTGAGSSYNIKWFNNSVQFATTTTPFITYTKGTITDTITARLISTAPGCYDSARSNKQVIRPTVGVEEVNQVAAIDVYPNPATNVVYVQGQAESYRIIDPVGVVIQSGLLQRGTNSISIDQLPTGLYLLDVVQDYQLHTLTKLNKR